MATSVVTICNLALSHIGDRATLTSIDPPEGSAQADYCAQFWPIARDEALGLHDWGFARRTAEATVFATEDHPRWQYAFARPTDFIAIHQLVNSDDGTTAPYFEEGTLANGQAVFFTDASAVAVRYTRVVTDPSRYPPLFTTGVTYLLASYLAGPVVKGRAGVALATTLRQAAMIALNSAATTDANQSHEHTRFRPSALVARGAVGDSRISEQGQTRRELPFWAQG